MIRSLQHIGITVPDLDVGKRFYERFGLESAMSSSDLVFRCRGREQDQIRLMEGEQKRLSYISLGTNAAGLQTIKSNLEAAGVAIERPPFRVALGGIWFKDPVGDWVNVTEADSAASAIPALPEINAPGMYRRIGVRGCTVATQSKLPQPRRLGHVIKFSPDVNKSVEFYTRVLGMKVSDRAGEILAFLRCSNGGDHHVLAFAKSSHSGLHHVSFEVGDIDEIEIGAQRLLQSGYRDGFGLGRHVGGSNYFHYIRDPWNSLAEYFWDIDIIPEDDSGWTALDLKPEEITMVWGMSPPPVDFVQNFELLP